MVKTTPSQPDPWETEAFNAWSFFLGLFEGEGSAYVTATGGVRLQLTSTDEDVVRWVQRLVGGNVNGPYTRKDRDDKPYWMWRTGRRDHVERLARAMIPNLGKRRRRQVLSVIREVEAA